MSIRLSMIIAVKETFLMHAFQFGAVDNVAFNITSLDSVNFSARRGASLKTQIE